MRFVMSDTTTLLCTALHYSRLLQGTMHNAAGNWVGGTMLNAIECSAVQSLTGARKLLELWSDLVTIEWPEEEKLI